MISRSGSSGIGTVLLVEDESSVRRLGTRILKQAGYSVLEASNGIEAEKVARNHAGVRIDLLLTDVVMPQMGGKELVDRLKFIHPETVVLYTSGYPDESIVDHGALEGNVEFLEKPFSAASLLSKVKDVLNGQGPRH